MPAGAEASPASDLKCVEEKIKSDNTGEVKVMVSVRCVSRSRLPEVKVARGEGNDAGEMH